MEQPIVSIHGVKDDRRVGRGELRHQLPVPRGHARTTADWAGDATAHRDRHRPEHCARLSGAPGTPRGGAGRCWSRKTAERAASMVPPRRARPSSRRFRPRKWCSGLGSHSLEARSGPLPVANFAISRSTTILCTPCGCGVPTLCYPNHNPSTNSASLQRFPTNPISRSSIVVRNNPARCLQMNPTASASPPCARGSL